jgi:hypothetical protein
MQVGHGVTIGASRQPSVLLDIYSSRSGESGIGCLVQKCYAKRQLRTLGFDVAFLPDFDFGEVAVSDVFEVVSIKEVNGECRIQTYEQFKNQHPYELKPNNTFYYKTLVSLDFHTMTFQHVEYKHVPKENRDLVCPSVTDMVVPSMSEYYQQGMNLARAIQRALKNSKDHRTISVPATSAVLYTVQTELKKQNVLPTNIRGTQVVIFADWTAKPSPGNEHPSAGGVKPLTLLGFLFGNNRWWKRFKQGTSPDGVFTILSYVNAPDFTLMLDYGHQVRNNKSAT